MYVPYFQLSTCTLPGRTETTTSSSHTTTNNNKLLHLFSDNPCPLPVPNPQQQQQQKHQKQHRNKNIPLKTFVIANVSLPCTQHYIAHIENENEELRQLSVTHWSYIKRQVEPQIRS